MHTFSDDVLEFVQAISSSRNRGVLLGTDVVYKKYAHVYDEVSVYAHPNLVLILGKTANNDIICEFLPKKIEAKTKLAPQTALRIMLGICAGVQYLRGKGIEYLTKPLTIEDVLLTDTSEAKIKESVYIKGPKTGGTFRIDDVKALGKILERLVESVSGEKDGVLRHLRSVYPSDSVSDFSSLYRSLRQVSKQNRPDETEALTPFLLGQ